MPYFQRALDDDPASLTAINGLGLAYLEGRTIIPDGRGLLQALHRTLDEVNYSCNDNLAADLLEWRFGSIEAVAGSRSKLIELALSGPEALGADQGLSRRHEG